MDLDQHEIEFKDIYYNILSNNDPYFVLKDFEPYLEIKSYVEQVYRDKLYGSIECDECRLFRQVLERPDNQDYATEIWKVKPV